MWTLHFIFGIIAGLALTYAMLKNARFKADNEDILTMFFLFGVCVLLGFVSAICIFSYLVFHSFVKIIIRRKTKSDNN